MSKRYVPNYNGIADSYGNNPLGYMAFLEDSAAHTFSSIRSGLKKCWDETFKDCEKPDWIKERDEVLARNPICRIRND